MLTIASTNQPNKLASHQTDCQCKQCQTSSSNLNPSLALEFEQPQWAQVWETEDEEEQFIGDLWNSITGAINQARKIDRNNPQYIKWVQRSLNQVLGLQLTVDGIGGLQTRSAIRSFQQRNGLAADGIVGESTEAKLIAAVARKPAGNVGYGEKIPVVPTQPIEVTRWILPDLVRRSGESQTVRYDSPPPWHGGKKCTGSLTLGAKQLRDFLFARFPGIEGIGGYNCRQNSANAAEMSVHGTGRALDIMIATVGRGKANTAIGDPVANWLVQNAKLIGIQIVLWDRTIWNGSKQGRKDRPYTGPNPHVDHIHVELNRDGAFKNTAWFAERV